MSGLSKWFGVVVIALAAQAALAQQYGPPSGMQMGPMGPTGAGGPMGMPGTPVASQQALDTAKDQLKVANEQVARLTKDAKEQLTKSDPTWSAAEKSLVDAKKELEAAKAEALAQVHATEEYKTQKTKLDTADAELKAGNATSEGVVEATSARIDARIAITSMEKTALAKSPRVLTAEASIKAAQAELDAKWDAYKTTELADSRPWNAAIRQQEQAQAAVKAAQEQVAADRAAAAAQRVTQPRTPRSTGSRQGGSSRSRSGGGY